MNCYDYFDKRECELPELPENIFIEIFMGCNLRCRMCPVPNSKDRMEGRKFSKMTIEAFEKIIGQVSDKPRKLWLNQLGEPLLNSNILDFVRIAKSKGHHVAFTTNGTRMTNILAKNLLSIGLDEIVFSFDGYKKETYEKIRIGAKYEEVISNIKTFSSLRKELKAPCIIRVDCIISDLTYPEIDDVKEFWKDSVDCINFIPLDDWAGQLNLPEEFGKRRSIPGNKKNRYPCQLLWTTMAISAEGRVMYCCHDYKHRSNLPTIFEKPLAEIWRGEIRDERSKHALNIIDREPCKSCLAWKTMPEYFEPESLISKIHKEVFNLKERIKKIFKG